MRAQTHLKDFLSAHDVTIKIPNEGASPAKNLNDEQWDKINKTQCVEFCVDYMMGESLYYKPVYNEKNGVEGFSGTGTPFSKSVGRRPKRALE